MDLLTSGEHRSAKERRLRTATSKLLRSGANGAPVSSGHNFIPRWNQSSLSVAMLPPADTYGLSHPYSSAPRQPLSKVPVVQQHNWASTTNLPSLTNLHSSNDELTNASAFDNIQDVIGDRLSEIISSIDEDSYANAGKEIVISISPAQPQTSSRNLVIPLEQSYSTERRLTPYVGTTASDQVPQNRNVNILAKLSYYSNSRLPASLPPFRAYISTYPLLCLAALCSANAYNHRQAATNNEQLISANTRIGTKAMVIKSVTCADEKTIVIAVRGTSVLSLRDWNVNLNTMPESPAGFLDDEGNYCHSGFLRVAKAMITPVALHLRHLLEENPHRLSYSLLITGHSAGGAVASLLYAHMQSENIRSDLTILTDCFKRVHCVTFGAPPISLLPLRKPVHKERKLQKSLFHSFINEGDPVVRAEKSYVLSLVDLLTTNPPSASSTIASSSTNAGPHSKLPGLGLVPKLRITNLGLFTNPKKQNAPPRPPRPPAHSATSKPDWAVPPGVLSNAGRLVVLRGPEPPPKTSMSQIDLTKEFDEVRAYTVTDDEIRKVIFGDPLMHAMDVYRRRIEALAMKAVTGREKYY